MAFNKVFTSGDVCQQSETGGLEGERLGCVQLVPLSGRAEDTVQLQKTFEINRCDVSQMRINQSGRKLFGKSEQG